MRKKLRMAGLILIALIGLLLLGIAFHNHRNKQSLARFKAELLAKGEKLKLSELTHPPSANPAHVASRKVFQKEEFDVPEMRPMAMYYASAGKARTGWLGKLYLVPTNDDESLLIGDWAKLERENRENASKLQPFIAALSDPAPDSGWLFKDDFDDSIKYDLPNRSVGVRVGDALQMMVVVNLHDREFEQAVSNLNVLIKLTQLYRNEPTLLCHLIRVHNTLLGIEAAWEALQATNWDGAGLAALQQKWEAVELLDGLERGLVFERSTGALAMQMIRDAKPEEWYSMFSFTDFNAVGKVNKSFNPLKSWRRRAVPFLYRAFGMDEDELFQLQFYSELLDAVRSLKEGRSAVKAYRQIKAADDRATRRIVESPTHRLIVAKLRLIRGLDGVLLKVVQVETFRRIAITAIAIRRYQLGHDSLPPDLLALTPEFLASVPIDLMSGKPLCYRLNPDGSWVLYSVGIDGKDDGGDPRPVDADGKSGLWEGRDAVWPVAATPEEEAAAEAAVLKRQSAPLTR